MRKFHAVLFTSLIAASAFAQGPDVIVGAISGPGNYGTDGSGIFAYSLGTDSCNIGTQPLNWVAGTNQHPVISQTIFRLKPVAGQSYSRFEQVGMSWLKHGFTALAQNLCATCQNPGTGSLLGVNCSDPYSSSLNGSQSNGPRSDINAATGYFPYPSTAFPAAPATIGRRIQCQLADIDPTVNVGATYFGEAQYVAADDAAAGNDNNNASYRRLQFAAGTYNASFVSGAGTVQQKPAIEGWKDVDPNVLLTYVDVPGDGRFIIAKRVSSLGGGNYHYEFAVHNLNSDRAGRAFTVDFPVGTTITNAGFHDINYHSFEIWDGTDWTVSINGSSINWATQDICANPNANALRWGTAYTYWFDATAAAESNKTIDLFKPANTCPPDPIVTGSTGYALDTNAPYDNPTLTAPLAGPTGDDSALSVPIGFTFAFFGTNYTTAYINTNGTLHFGASSTAFGNANIPNAAAPNTFIAGYWDDLITPPGNITYQTLGTAPNRRFVASWNAVGRYNATSTLESFKILLDETTNKITTTIVSSMGGGASATRGIENQTGTLGIQASYNAAGSAVAGTSHTYVPTTAVVPSANLTVTGSTGPNGVLTWNVNSNAKNAPVILIASLDPGPIDLGPLGILNIGITPGAFAVVADGAGVLQAANPAHFTDCYCGDLQVQIPLGPAGLPPGLTVYNQGVVLSSTTNPPPPNGAFHITTAVTLNT